VKPSRLTFLLALLLAGSCFAAGAASGTQSTAPTASQPGYDSHAGKPIIRDDSPAPAGSRTTDSVPTVDLDSGHIALALSGVIGLILLLRYCGTKFFPATIVSGRPQAVRVLSRTPLAPRQQVVLIQIGRRIVVAGDSGGQLTSLAQITDADEVAALVGEISRTKTIPIGRSFTGWFKKAADGFAPDDAGLASDEDAPELMPSNLDILDEDDGVPAPTAAESAGIRDLTEKVRRLRRKLGSA